MEIIVKSEESTASDDMRTALGSSDTAPEEAAQNISRASLFEVTPDSYKTMKSQLDPEALAIERVPAKIEPQTDSYMRQSEQHANLVKDDIDTLNAFEKRARYYKQNIVDMPDLNRDINELIGKKMDTGVLDQGDEEMLQELNAQKRQMEADNQNFDIGDGEKFVVDVASGGVDMLRSYWDNKELLLGSIGAGAAVGGGVGLATPIPGATIVGLQAGAVKGAIAGSTLVGFIDGYQQTSRSLYNELSSASDDQGRPLNIPHERMANVSRSVGVLAGVAGGLAGKVLASNNAFMKRFLNPKSAAKYVTNPAVLAKMDILGGIAKSALSEGAEEGFQEFIQTVGSAFGKMDESEASFMNALDEATSAENLKKYAYSGAVGVGTGGVVQAVTSAPGYKGLKERHQQVADVTARKQEVLQAQNNMLELAEDVKRTKLNEISPAEMGNFKKKVFSALGVNEDVWYTMEDIREFANTPEKAEAVRKIVDPTGDLTKMAQELNTPLQISKADALNVITEFPEFTDYMRLTPEGENPLAVRNEAKNFVERLDQAEAKRNAVLESLGFEKELNVSDLEKQLKETEDSQSKKYLKKQIKILKGEAEIESNIEEGAADESNLRGLPETGDIGVSEVDLNGVKNKAFVFRDEEGKPQGVLKFKVDENGKLETRADYTDGLVTYVTSENRRKGIATKLYDAAKKAGYNVDKISGMFDNTPSGAEFAKGRKSKQNVQLTNETLSPVKDSKYFNSREEFMERSAIQPIDGIVTNDEALAFDAAHREARIAIDEEISGEVNRRMDRQENSTYRTETENEIAVETKRLEKELTVVQSFQKPKTSPETNPEITSRHKKKGFSAFAIDPRSLPEDLKEIYLANDTLKQRKAFVEGGIDIEESAAMQGFESGADLLRALADTPTKKQIEQRIKSDPLRTAANRDRIASDNFTNRLAKRDEAFSKITNMHLREMDYMTKKEWPTTKRGMIKIAGKTPTVEALNARAKDTVGKMKIRDLNANRFKTGESKSQQAAVKNYLNGEFEQAFANKEKAALNNEMRKETVKSMDKVERHLKFWKRIDTPTMRQELKDANMDSTMEEFMNLYKLSGDVRAANEQKNFNAFMRRQAESGNYVPAVPERLDNTQTSYRDLTVEQYEAISEMGEFIVNQAKLKNKLMKQQESRTELRTAETVAADIETHTKENINYDLNKVEKLDKDYLSVTEKFHEGVQTSLSAIASVKTVISELDGYKLDGYFHRLIGKPIKEARTAKRTEIDAIVAHDKDIIKTFYGDKFHDNYSFLSIPEFANMPMIGDGEGSVRKVDLLVMQAYMGDPDGRKAIANFTDRNGIPVDVDTVQAILDRELTSNDAAFVQNFLIDRFKQFEQRSADLHKRTTGLEPEMVKGIPFVHKGKVYPGGYYPIKRKMITDAERAGKFLENFKNQSEELGLPDEGHFFAQMRTAEMTQQGRLKERTGSARPLDLNFENFINFTEEAVHDLNFREVGMDTLKILKNPVNVTNMKAVVGNKKFVALLNGVKDMVSKTTERESTLFVDENSMINKGIQIAHSLHAIKSIGFNVTSAAVQADSLTNLMLRVGPKTGIYLAKTAAKMTSNITNYDKYVQLAQEINPDIKFEQDGIDNSIIKSSYDFLPVGKSFFKNYKNVSGSTLNRIATMKQKAIDASFFLVRESDKFNKVLMTHAISEQFLNGDVEGYSMDRLNKMTDAEKADAMRSVIQQASDLSLTSSATEDKTAIEKNKVASIFVRYWTDRRSRLNSVLAQIDKTKGAIKKGDNVKAAQHAVTLAFAMGTSAAFVNMIRNDEESILKEAKKIKDADDVTDFAIGQAWNFAKAPVEQTISTIPLLDNIKYQTEIDVKSDYRNVSTPLFGVMSDVAAGYVIMRDSLDMAIKGRKVSLSDTQRKILLTNAGYLVGGAPTNTINKAWDAINQGKVRKGSKFMADEMKSLNETIDTYINEFKDEPEAQEFIEDLKEYKKTVPQDPDSELKNIIPEDTKTVMKESLSGGKWDKFDPDTGAAGIYQFTEQRWSEIARVNPDLGLTENGRVAKNPAQQEKAMNWEIQDISRGFLTYEIPVTESNILGAHKFGFDNFAAISEAGDNEKLSEVLGEEANNPVFKNFTTVKSVKNYLSRQGSKGK
jgi:hypothetical protein